MYLGLWGRFLVMGAGGLVVIVAVIVVACFVGPGCWGFEFLQKEEKKKKQKSLENIRPETVKNGNSKLGLHWLDNNDYIIYQTGPRGFEEKIQKVEDATLYHSEKERVFNLKCAPLLVAPSLYSNIKEPSPKLEIKIYYSEQEKDDIMGRLTVHIISAASLPCREYIATLDPYVILEILNNKWSLQKNERIVHVVETRIVKNSTNPVFNQTFVFDVKKIELKNWCLKFIIVDYDRITRITPLFEKRIYLKDAKNLTVEKQISLTLEMQKVFSNIGALFFGVTFLPTAQKLNINIVRASRIKYQSFAESLNDFCPYVRVVMVNNHGKCLKKKKTSFKRGDDNPNFNQSLIFELSISNLEQTVFLVLLCAKSQSQQSNSEDSSFEGDFDTSQRENKDKVIGGVVLGRNVKCPRARDHWVSVMQNPRKTISVWHDLR